LALGTIKTIGILGGVGPEATCLLYRMLVSESRARSGGQSPAIYLYSLPVTSEIERSMISGSMSKEHVAALRVELEKGMTMMMSQGVREVALPCNTLTHYARPMIQGRRFHNPVDAVARRVKADGHRRVGILASTATRKLRLFENALEPLGADCEYPKPSEQETLARYIIGQLVGAAATIRDDEILTMMRKLGEHTDVIVLGCTDLFLLAAQAKNAGLAVIDSLEELTASCIAQD